MHRDVESILLTKEQVLARTKELADRIAKDYAGEPVLMVCILRGAVLFFSDLVRMIDGEVDFDFMAVSSYGAGAKSSGEVTIIKDVSRPIEGRNVIMVEDVIDSGNTLHYLKRLLLERKPKSLKICAMLDKPECREAEIEGDYVGFCVPNKFVVGYGLDFNEKYRNLNDICILKSEIYD